MSDLPDGTMSLEEAASRLGLDVPGVERLIAAGALQIAADGRAVTQVSVLLHLSTRVRATIAQVSEPPSAPGGVLGAIGIRVLLVLSFMFSMVEVFSLQDDNAIVPVPALLLGVAGVLGLCVWLARRQPDLGSSNGFGTTLYGSRRTADGLVGTAYLVIAMIPVAPVRSYVVLEQGAEKVESAGMIRTRGYLLRALPGICWPQAAPMLALGWSAFLLGGYLLATMG